MINFTFKWDIRARGRMRNFSLKLIWKINNDERFGVACCINVIHMSCYWYISG